MSEIRNSEIRESGIKSFRESGIDPVHLQTMLSTLSVDVKKLNKSQGSNKRLVTGLVVLLILSLVAFAVILAEFLSIKKDDAPPGPVDPVFLNQESLTVNNADFSFIKYSNLQQADSIEKVVDAEDYILMQSGHKDTFYKNLFVYSPKKQTIVAEGTCTDVLKKDEETRIYGNNKFAVVETLSASLNYTQVMEITEFN